MNYEIEDICDKFYIVVSVFVNIQIARGTVNYNVPIPVTCPLLIQLICYA
jgi:hypothetical protein